MSKKVEFNSYYQLFILFAEKNWTSRDEYKDVLKRFGELMETLEPDQVNLILELTERYKWLSYNEYNSTLRKLLIELHKALLSDISKLYVFPIKKLDDEQKTKSGDAVKYMLTGIKPSLDQYRNIELVLLEGFEDISKEKLSLNDDEFVILVDDYIGSGKTLDSTIEELKKNSSIKDKFAILTTIIQDNTIKELEDLKVHLFYGFSLKKGISSYYEKEELEEKKNLMDKIEDKIPGVKNYRFGFEKSEALTTLIRTPNNTFPIFWKDYKHKKDELKAPFPRY